MEYNKIKKITAVILSVLIISTILTTGCSKDSSNNNYEYDNYDEAYVDNQTVQESSETSLAESSTQSVSSVDNYNTVNYENISYKVNPLLSSNEEIDYIDFEESNGITCVEFGWNCFSNNFGEGVRDCLIMYYDDSLSNVQNGKQSILGSVYHRFNDDQTSEWLYFGAENNLIYKTNGYQIYDENDNIIGYYTQEGNCYDNDDNPLDLESLDPFIEIFNDFED